METRRSLDKKEYVDSVEKVLAGFGVQTFADGGTLGASVDFDDAAKLETGTNQNGDIFITARTGGRNGYTVTVSEDLQHHTGSIAVEYTHIYKGYSNTFPLTSTDEQQLAKARNLILRHSGIWIETLDDDARIPEIPMPVIPIP